MLRRLKIALGTAAVVAALAGGTGAAVAGGAADDDANETPITGADLERASAAALEHTGGGRVTATELEDEESRYEVEVTRADGRQVEVELDEGFAVVGSETDDDTDDTDGTDDRD